MQKMTYDTVVTALVDAIPECRKTRATELKWWGEAPPPPDPYTVLGFALRPLLNQLSSESLDEETVRRIFTFYEEMANSQDTEVVNLLQVSELEFLIGKPDLLSRAWRYMGERTKALARETAKIWKSEQNLPAGE
jgi:hypothetical protein